VGHDQPRLALLGDAMVDAGEHEVDRAVVAHAVPSTNTYLQSIVPSDLARFGVTWHRSGRLLPGPRVTYRCADSLPWLASHAGAERTIRSCTNEVGGVLASGPPPT